MVAIGAASFVVRKEVSESIVGAVRAGIRGALEKAADVVMVGEAADGEEALRLIEALRPDVALLDCRLPGLEGAQVAEAMRARGLPTRVLALSAYADERYVYGRSSLSTMRFCSSIPLLVFRR
jgi:DNA-binding NarL/FixJ family response regulator